MSILNQTPACPHCSSPNTVLLGVDLCRCNLCGKEFSFGDQRKNREKKPIPRLVVSLAVLGISIVIIFYLFVLLSGAQMTG